MVSPVEFIDNGKTWHQLFVDIYDSNSRANKTKNKQMGYTATDTVSCRLLPLQIAQLRELAAIKEISLSRFVSGLCLDAIQGHGDKSRPIRLTGPREESAIV